MNDDRRLELAKRNISLVNQLKLLKEIYKEEEYAIEEIKSESRKDEAEQGLGQFEDLINQLEEVCEMFDEVAQGNYSNILDKEQRKQEKVKEEKIKAEKEKKRLEQEEKKIFHIKEFAAFKKEHPNFKLDSECDIEHYNRFGYNSVEGFYEWKYIDNGLNDKYGDPILEHTPAYKIFLEAL